MSSDRIADLLTSIRNASLAKHRIVSIPYSLMAYEISKILVTEGYVTSFLVHCPELIDPKQGADEYLKREILFELKYQKDKPFIRELKRISKPGQRKYVKAKKIPVIVDGFGKAILSTSEGVMTGDNARDRGIGGEVLFSIW